MKGELSALITSRNFVSWASVSYGFGSRAGSARAVDEGSFYSSVASSFDFTLALFSSAILECSFSLVMTVTYPRQTVKIMIKNISGKT